jgi:hypothetical protein
MPMPITLLCDRAADRISNYRRARMAQTRRVGRQNRGAELPKTPRFSPYRCWPGRHAEVAKRLFIGAQTWLAASLRDSAFRMLPSPVRSLPLPLPGSESFC